MPARPLTPSSALSRRAALTGAGLGALAVLAGPALTARALTASAPGGSTTSLPLGSGSGASGLRSLLSTASGTSVVDVEVTGGSMLGVAFPAGTTARSVDLRVRRTGGGWGPWSTLEVGDGAPDDDRPGDGPGTVVATDPVWTGDLRGGATVQVRLPAGEVGGARLEVVDPGTGVRTATPVPTTATTAATGALAVTTLDAEAVAAPRIRSRAEWGADESLRRSDPSYSYTIKACVVHHTADGGSYSQAEVPSVIRGMYRYHTVSLGWSDLGYNFVVDRFGGIWEGRFGGTTKPVVGAHAGGFNTDTFGVSMMGDFTSVAPSEACLESVARVIAWKLSTYGLTADGRAVLTSAGGGTARYSAGTVVTLRTINGHRDVGFTACPGNVGFTKMGQIRSRVAALIGAAPTSPIEDRYKALGGGAGFLGAPTTAEGTVPAGNGSYRYYRGGAIYFSPSTGARVVRGALLAEYSRLGWETSGLGFPTSDDSPAAGGFFTHFQGGSIYWSAATGAHDVRGLIREKWASQGWERGPLGFPTTGDSRAAGGWFTHFQGGSIYWSAGTGAHITRGGIRDKWASLGWERGLGFPLADDTRTPNGRGWYNHFQGGSIYWSEKSGTHVVRGGFRDKWASLGWENGYLGFPTRDEYGVSGGLKMDFEGGTMTYSAKTGQITVQRAG